MLQLMSAVKNTPLSPWKMLHSRIVYQNQYVTIYEDDVIKPNGTQGTYTYNVSPPFVLIVAYDDTKLLFVRQYRYPLGEIAIEFPGGGIDGDETTLSAAQRELQEEAGYQAVSWTKLGEVQ